MISLFITYRSSLTRSKPSVSLGVLSIGAVTYSLGITGGKSTNIWIKKQLELYVHVQLFNVIM